MSRAERLERWADAPERRGHTVRALRAMEFVPWREARAMRADGSALSVAFADPVLRTGGLQGDRYEDAVALFGLRDDEAHYILCSCHAGGETTSTRPAAARVRETARWRRDVGLCLAVASLIFGSAVTAMAIGII